MQGNLSESAYFTKLERLWMELASLAPMEVEEIISQNQLMQFLVGLNDRYDDLRNQILMMEPLPSVSIAYLAVLNAEQQFRKVPMEMVDVADDSTVGALKRAAFVRLQLKKLMQNAIELDPLKNKFAGVVFKEYSSQSSLKLPEDILINIFAPLPAKSAAKCSCLSKNWQSLLSIPYFAKLHVTQHIHRENLILSGHSCVIGLITNIDNLSHIKMFELPKRSSLDIIGSCHGLVVLGSLFMEEFLLNPTTQQLYIIPDPPTELREGMNFYKCQGGLGYDSSMDDYKYVKFAHGTKNPEANDVPVGVIIYSVKRGVWRRFEDSSLCVDQSRKLIGHPPFVNGALHWWLAGGDPLHPLTGAAFNMVDEVFDVIPGPDNVDGINELTVLVGNLCLVSKCSGERVDVWVMKEYGLAESWTKFSIRVKLRIRPLCYDWNGDFLFLSGGRLLAYDEKQKRKRLVVDEYFRDASTFVEPRLAYLQQQLIGEGAF